MEEEKRKVLKLLGNRIKKLRQEKEFSQERFADEAGIERSYMGAIERGQRNATFFKLVMIAKALKISLKELFDF